MSDTRYIFIPEMHEFGGAERILLALSRFLHARNLAHAFVTYYCPLDLQKYAQWPLEIRQLSPRRNALFKINSLKNFLSDTANTSRRPLLVGIQAALHVGAAGSSNFALMILDTPSLLSASEPSLARKIRESLARKCIARAMRNASVTIATTQYMADEIRQLYAADAVVSRQGTNIAPRPREQKENGQTIRFLSVCRLESNKRVDWILRSLARLQGSWTLDIVGKGSERAALEELAKQLGVAARVHFHGHVSDEALEKLYGQCSIFLMPARQGYGLPALEALTRNIPVVMHRESGVSEILGGSPWVELISGDEAALGQACEAMTQRVASGALKNIPLPKFPTEDEWSEEICRLCGWL